MLSEPGTLRPPAAWYVIACDGDLMLRLAQDLHIGEDESGEILLSPAREDALLKVCTNGHELTLQAAAMDLTFSEAGGPPLQHITFLPGAAVRINFPRGSLLVAPDFLAGQRIEPDRIIDVVETTPPAVALSRLSEPITLVDQPALTWQPDAGSNNTEELVAILDEPEQANPHALLDCDHDIPDGVIPTLRESVTGPPAIRAPTAATTNAAAATGGNTTTGADKEIRARAPAPAARPDPQPTPAEGTSPAQVERQPAVHVKPRHGAPALLRGALAATLLLAPMIVFFDAPEQVDVGVGYADLSPDQGATTTIRSGTEGVDPAPTPSADPGEVPAATPEPGVAVTAEPASSEPVETVVGPTGTKLEPPAAAADGDGTLPATPATSHTLTDVQVARVGLLLDEAQTLFDADHIVTPLRDNAVERLIKLLAIDPTNDAGLHLMYLCAARLVEEAEAAHAAGNDYLARNLLEDVLGFHPEFEPARQLRKEWMGG
jgi:hypothetical protein